MAKEQKLNGTVIVTYRCNARCSMCNRYKAPSKAEEEISIETIKKLPKMYFTNITGGEPFIRTDLKDIIREIYKKYKKNKYIGMLGISLDVDKQQWKDAIKRDTLEWEQVCDFGGLNSEVAKQYSVWKIPANILLSSDGKIVAKNLQGEELKKKIEKIVEESAEKEKKNKQKK